MYLDNQIYIGKSGDEKISILPGKANRHGMVCGATGTGKTVTLKVMAEAFSDAGVPVFVQDVKGDFAGICQPGKDSEDMQERIQRFGLEADGFEYKKYPVSFWDIYGERGLPLRTTISEMGPTLLSQLLELTDTQSDILNIIFRIADDEDLLLIDTKDLRSMISYVAEHSKDYSAKYGNMTKQSLNVIQRGVAALETEGADIFFGEPALDIKDWIRTDNTGRGLINVLDSTRLINSPKMYSTFLLWMLSELFEVMPEVGDLEKPKMIFFFDEAHLLFNNASKSLLQKIEQVVKLIRSKGVGIYFITQNPKDIPDGVLAQLSNKIQHALHAYTPAEQKGLKAAADSFRENPEFNTLEVLQELGTGEALVSVLQDDGTPSVVKRVKILPPQSYMGAIEDSTRDSVIKEDILYVRYKESVDRDSAYEFLQRVAAQDAEAKELEAQQKAEAKELEAQQKAEAKALEAQQKAEAKAAEKKAAARQNQTKRVAKSVASTTGGTVGREIGKQIGNTVGGSFGKTLGGNIGASLGRGILGTLFGK